MSLFWHERVNVKIQVRPLFDSRFRAAVVGTVRGAATAFRLSKRKWSLRPCRSVTGVRKNDTSISAVRGNPCLDWAACHRRGPWSRSHFLPGCGGQRSSRGRLGDHSRELPMQIQYGSESDQNLFQLVGYRPRDSSRLSRGLHKERHDPNHLVVPHQQVFLRWKSVAACRKARGESLFLQPASLAAIGRRLKMPHVVHRAWRRRRLGGYRIFFTAPWTIHGRLSAHKFRNPYGQNRKAGFENGRTLR